MKTDYEKAIEWLNKKAEKAGGITNLGKTVEAAARQCQAIRVLEQAGQLDRLPEPTSCWTGFPSSAGKSYSLTNGWKAIP